MDREQLYLSILNNLPNGLYYVNLKREIQFWNKTAEELTGYTQEEMIGHACQDTFLNHIDENGIPLCNGKCPLYDTMIDGKKKQALVYLRHKEGYRVPIYVNISPIYEDGKIVGAVEIFNRPTTTIYDDNLIEKLTNASSRDRLTALPNRAYTQNYLEYKLSAYKNTNSPFAVMFFDIDNFSAFNNTYGHDMGDSVLINIAESLRRSMRKSDFVGRWGGEEFLGVFEIDSLEAAENLGEKIRILIQNTEVFHDENMVNVTASIGITLVSPEDTVESLIKRADELMYESKRNGKNCVTAE